MTWKDVLQDARERIAQDDSVVYDLAAHMGLEVEEFVKQSYCLVALAHELIRLEPKYADVKSPGL